MNRWPLLIAAAALMSSTAFADENGQAIIGSTGILRGRFTEERHLQGFNGPMRSEGHFTVALAEGVIWSVEKPFAASTVITPAGLAQIINGAQVMHLSAQKIPFMLHLYDMLGGALTGNWQALESDFTIERSGDAGNWRMALTPHDTDNPAMPFNAIHVSGHRFVETVEMLKPDGDSDIIKFSDEVMVSSPPTEAENRAFGAIGP